jgi:predicted transposase/invertase (TIGR01784 family)
MSDPETPEDIDFVHHPHDAFFKTVFSEPDYAADFFRQRLPPAVAAEMDWPSLRVLPKSFVKTSLEQVHADLLFSCTMAGRPALLYLLLEHQSTVDPLMRLRLLAYVLEILNTHAREHGLPLPVVYPYVLNQGPEIWSVSTEFIDMFELPARLEADLLPNIPKFRHGLLDLASVAVQTDASHTGIGIVLQFMKWARLRDTHAMCNSLLTWAQSMPDGLLKTSLLYALHCDTTLDASEILEILASSDTTREQAMTAAQQLIAKGEARGEALGEARGEARGKAEGLWIGRLQTLQELMGLPVDALEDFAGMSIAGIEARYHALHGEYTAKFKGTR